MEALAPSPLHILTCVLGKTSANGDVECFATRLEHREVGITRREGQRTCTSSTPAFLFHCDCDAERSKRKWKNSYQEERIPFEKRLLETSCCLG